MTVCQILELSPVATQALLKDRDVEVSFRRLVTEWKSRKSYSSCIEDLGMDLAYQQIIGLGTDAVPFILAELEREPDHWFWALFAITGVDPVPTSSRGKVHEMRKAWLKWGMQNGYRWSVVP